MKSEPLEPNEEDLECLELLNLNLDAKSSQMLLEALCNEDETKKSEDQQMLVENDPQFGQGIKIENEIPQLDDFQQDGGAQKIKVLNIVT